MLRNAGEEIHAPVVNILGMSSVLLKESNESTVHECARDIQRSGQLLLTLSENIVDITKVESDAIEIEMVEYDLFTVLSSCYSLAKSQNKEPRFELKVDNSIPGRLSGDEIRLRQVIENILFESEKFSTSGLATVWVGYELCADEDTEEWSSDSINLLIRVPDLGTGWTGTGLTLVKQLVYLMHGVIRQDSVEDGPVFTVVLPQKIVKNDPVGDFERRYESLMLSSDNGKKRFYAPKASVLAIDDVLMNLRVMGGMLRDACPHIDSVSNGVEALEKFKSNPYHIIFLAQSMPVIDGMDLLTIMKGIADSPNKDTPIVMLTDSNEAVARGVCKQMGYADFLTEPVREDALLAMLLQYLPKDLVEWSDMELEEPAKEKAPSLEQGGNAANKKMMEVVADAESERPELPDDLEKLMSTGMIEVLVGLECCQKNEALYRKRLVDYAGTYVDSALDAFLKREDFENYRLAMRVLKMKSMYIGAVPVASRAKSLEFACNEGHYGFIRSHHDDLIRQYRKLMQALREFV